jgi:CRP/FNR family cyclic AMP-dependent transcriptional regulator
MLHGRPSLTLGAASPTPLLAEGFGQDVGSGRIVIHQKIGQSDLAARAGIARANVSRILNE